MKQPSHMNTSAGPSSASQQLFTTSITSRRFPALRALTEDDVEVMALPPRPTADRRAKQATAGGKGDRLFDPDLVKPSAVSNLSPLAGVRAGLGAGGAMEGSTVSKKATKAEKAAEELAKRPPWTANNPTQARESITLERTGFVLIHSPFDMGFKQRQQERLEAHKRRLAGNWNVPSAIQAKEDMKVNYFLNSPDSETIEAERRCVRPAPAPAKCRHPLTSRGTSPRAATFARRRSAT